MFKNNSENLPAKEQKKPKEVHYFKGIIDYEQFIATKARRKALMSVAEGRYKEAGLDLKNIPKSRVYTVRVDEVERLAFTEVEGVIAPLGIIINHDYDACPVFGEIKYMRRFTRLQLPQLQARILGYEKIGFKEGEFLPFDAPETAAVIEGTPEVKESEEEEISWVEANYFELLQEHDESQQKAIRMPRPALLEAGPGTGKTVVLMEAVRQACAINPGRYLVVQQNTLQRNQKKAQWEKERANYPDCEVDIVSYEELVILFSKEHEFVPHRKAFAAWFADQSALKLPQSLVGRERDLYDAISILMVCNNEQHSRSLGKRAAILIAPHERQFAYQAGKAYNKYLRMQRQCDVFHFVAEWKKHYLAAFIEEAQDLTLIQISNIAQLVEKNKRGPELALVLDTRQSLIHDYKLDKYLHLICKDWSRESLGYGYRMPAVARAMCDYIKQIQDGIQGGTFDVKQGMEPPRYAGIQGTVRWFVIDKIDPMTLAILKERAKSKDFAVLINQDNSPDEAMALLETVQVLTPAQAKGFEFVEVGMYLSFDHQGQEEVEAYLARDEKAAQRRAKQIKSGLVPEETKEERSVKFRPRDGVGQRGDYISYCTHLYTDLSRTSRDLYIFVKEKDAPRLIAGLKKVVSEVAPDMPALTLPESTTSVALWLQQAQEYLLMSLQEGPESTKEQIARQIVVSKAPDLDYGVWKEEFLNRHQPVAACDAPRAAGLQSAVALELEAPSEADEALRAKKENKRNKRKEDKAKKKAKAQAEKEAQAKARAEKEAQAQAEKEAQAKARAEKEAQAQVEKEAQAKARAEAQAQAEKEAKPQADQEAQIKAKAKVKVKEGAKRATSRIQTQRFFGNIAPESASPPDTKKLIMAILDELDGRKEALFNLGKLFENEGLGNYLFDIFFKPGECLFKFKPPLKYRANLIQMMSSTYLPPSFFEDPSRKKALADAVLEKFPSRFYEITAFAPTQLIHLVSDPRISSEINAAHLCHLADFTSRGSGVFSPLVSLHRKYENEFKQFILQKEAIVDQMVEKLFDEVPIDGGLTLTLFDRVCQEEFMSALSLFPDVVFQGTINMAMLTKLRAAPDSPQATLWFLMEPRNLHFLIKLFDLNENLYEEIDGAALNTASFVKIFFEKEGRLFASQLIEKNRKLLCVTLKNNITLFDIMSIYSSELTYQKLFATNLITSLDEAEIQQIVSCWSSPYKECCDYINKHRGYGGWLPLHTEYEDMPLLFILFKSVYALEIIKHLIEHNPRMSFLLAPTLDEPCIIGGKQTSIRQALIAAQEPCKPTPNIQGKFARGARLQDPMSSGDDEEKSAQMRHHEKICAVLGLFPVYQLASAPDPVHDVSLSP